MAKPKLLIGLRNPIDAFSLQPTEWDTLVSRIGDRYELVQAQNKEAFLSHLSSAEIVVCWTFLEDWYAMAPRLKAIYTPSAGRDWIAPDPTGRVTIGFGSFHGPLMRESLLAMMFYFNRRLDLAVMDKSTATWDRNRYSSLTALGSQHVVIIGLGNIGLSCAEALKALGCTITGVKRTALPPPPSIDRVVTMDNLETVLPDADHIVCILPGGTATDGILTADHFSKMKPGAYLYNLGRGNCYNELDLVNALTHGPLAGAGLDVFAEEPLPQSSPLWSMDNVMIMPHASAICANYLPAFIDELIPKL